MTDPQEPRPAFAVSPDDQSSDRQQSDNNNDAAVASAAANQAVNVEMLDRLIAASEAQTASNEDLALAAVEYQERARLARRRFRITIVALITASVVTLAVLAVILAKINANLDSAARARAQLADCIKPTGQCFKDNQARTGAVVGSVNQVSVLAAACAPAYVGLPLDQRIVAIQGCIERHLPK